MVLVFQCRQCGLTFSTARGLSTHTGICHKDDTFPPPERARKRRRRSAAAMPARPPPEEAEMEEEEQEEEAEMPALDFEEEEELTPPKHRPADPAAAAPVAEGEDVVAAAREEARQMLRDPSWVQYAEEQLAYCEEGLLQDVGQLFPSVEQFETEETYRYKKMYHHILHFPDTPYK